MDKKKFIREYGIITLGIFIISMAVYFFMIPSNVIVGSLSGLVIVLANFVPLPISVMTFILNAALLVIGFIFIGKEFGAKTVYTSIMLPVFLFIFEKIVPNNKSLTGDILIDTICYILVVSIGLAMLFNANASSGGLDIVAKIVNKYLHVEIGKAMTITGMCVAVSSIFVYGTKEVILSILATYVNGIVIDNFIGGFNRRKRVCILSDHYEVVQKFITEELKRGVTLYAAVGGYNKTEKIEIVTILTQNEYGKLLEYLHTVDMRAFVTVSTVNEVIGEWNVKKKVRG
ncbi:MAG: YitT family protein [Lachnospiraceae bacterium]|nr:YitT family protein [Lachnospiraceae bacterium]MDO4451596.1 YitT family protein [Lachnospiraceae bacterium]MDU3180654.1 YitT family protein [Lachnospiraceae bacterium]